jgi:hypothetical protein
VREVAASRRREQLAPHVRWCLLARQGFPKPIDERLVMRSCLHRRARRVRVAPNAAKRTGSSDVQWNGRFGGRAPLTGVFAKGARLPRRDLLVEVLIMAVASICRSPVISNSVFCHGWLAPFSSIAGAEAASSRQVVRRDAASRRSRLERDLPALGALAPTPRCVRCHYCRRRA